MGEGQKKGGGRYQPRPTSAARGPAVQTVVVALHRRVSGEKPTPRWTGQGMRCSVLASQHSHLMGAHQTVWHSLSPVPPWSRPSIFSLLLWTGEAQGA